MRGKSGIPATILFALFGFIGTASAAAVNLKTLSASVGGATIPIYLYEQAAVEEHGAILTALKAKDGDRLASLLHDHLLKKAASLRDLF
jgi:DNA-binding GntR family transcriptional regulator